MVRRRRRWRSRDTPMADTNITVVVEEPRPGDGLKKAALTRPGALITLIALTPEAGASMAVVRA